MRVCLVNERDAERIEHEGAMPDCRFHKHMNYAEAAQLVGDGTTGELRWVQTASNVGRRCVTPTSVILGYSSRPSCERTRNGYLLSAVFTLQGVTR